ncbi:hypothetical protein C922_04566 [Plasmodium inui San Antonio 1]|uniref:Erythrocyte vesicle protein 1 n=1 Tax=Plasmodium inui San Antonio 1 TaxID=1237626 RepID=W7A0H1_9APIC|nr:hypothetical protein C922_04566 [Plasmodium inui San Antonio 1]EUD65055.1 hypothetical protein C922_04566 [Plasmodium inui San Antonio 1]
MLIKVVSLLAALYLRAAYVIDVDEDFPPTTSPEGDQDSSHPAVLTECNSSKSDEDSNNTHASGDLTGIPEGCFKESDQSSEDGGEVPSATTPARYGQESCQESSQGKFQENCHENSQGKCQDSCQDSFQPTVTLSSSVGVPPDPQECTKKMLRGEKNSCKNNLNENVTTASIDKPVPNKNNFRQDFLNFYHTLIGKGFNRSKADQKEAEDKFYGRGEKECKEKDKHDPKVKSTLPDDCFVKDKEISQNPLSVAKEESRFPNEVTESEEEYDKTTWGMEKHHLIMRNGGSISLLGGLDGLDSINSVRNFDGVNTMSTTDSVSGVSRDVSGPSAKSGSSSSSDGKSGGGSNGSSSPNVDSSILNVDDSGVNLGGGSPSMGSSLSLDSITPNMGSSLSLDSISPSIGITLSLDSSTSSIGSTMSVGNISTSSSDSGSRTYHDKMLTHLFSLAILFYSNKTYFEEMAKKLPENYYLSYKELQQNMNRKYENNFTEIYEDFYALEKKKNPIEEKGIEKYYYAFNRLVYTLLLFLYGILQKEDALHLSFESLPLEYRLRRQELMEAITKSTPSDMNDIYFTTYKFFDSMCTCLDLSSCFNFNYLGKKIFNNLDQKGNPQRKITLEVKKINEYMTNIHSDIVEYITDLNSYFKEFVDYATRENLFCEPVSYCYSLFLDYYLSTMDQLMDHLNIHLRYPVNKESQENLSHIYKEIKTHTDNLGCTMRSFYFKNSIKSDPELSISSFFTDSKFRFLLADKYVSKKYSDFIALMLSIIDYLRVLVASLTSLVTLQTVHALLLDTENENIKYVDAMKALRYLTKYLSDKNSIFAAPGRRSTSGQKHEEKGTEEEGKKKEGKGKEEKGKEEKGRENKTKEAKLNQTKLKPTEPI